MDFPETKKAGSDAYEYHQNHYDMERGPTLNFSQQLKSHILID